MKCRNKQGPHYDMIVFMSSSCGGYESKKEVALWKTCRTCTYGYKEDE